MLLTLCLLALSTSVLGAGQPKLNFAWNEVTFQWPSEEQKASALQSGAYIPKNNLPVGIAVWKDKVFLTIPRWRTGVASSLNYIKVGSPESAPLIPYPSWEDNYIEDVTKGLKSNATVASVFRLWVDKCDRLWIMDTGVSDILGDTKVISPPALVIFDLKTDKLIRRYEFKQADTRHNSFLANVVVDVESDKCDDAFAYVPDLGGNGLVVYDFKNDKSWRVEHHYFHFDPLSGTYNVEGIEFHWTDGIFGVAISNKLNDGSRNVIFHAFSSTKEFLINNQILQNETEATNSKNYHLFKLLGERGVNSQASANYFDERSNVLLYTQVNRNGVACWNINKPLTPDNTELVVQNGETLIFPNDIKVDDKGLLWILSDRLPKFMYSQLDSKEINYRVFSIPVQEAIKGTRCDV